MKHKSSCSIGKPLQKSFSTNLQVYIHISFRFASHNPTRCVLDSRKKSVNGKAIQNMSHINSSSGLVPGMVHKVVPSGRAASCGSYQCSWLKGGQDSIGVCIYIYTYRYDMYMERKRERETLEWVWETWFEQRIRIGIEDYIEGVQYFNWFSKKMEKLIMKIAHCKT